MKYLFSIIIVLCVGLTAVILTTNNKSQSTDKVYQHYFTHCLKNAAASQMDAETSNRICECVASAVVDGLQHSKDLSEDELQNIALMCLDKHFLNKQ